MDSYDIRRGFIIAPPLLGNLDPNVFLSDKIMNCGTGVWDEQFDKDKFQVCVYSSMEELESEAIGPGNGSAY